MEELSSWLNALKLVAISAKSFKVELSSFYCKQKAFLPACWLTYLVLTGAMIACKLAALGPDRVLSLALLNVTGGGFECFPKVLILFWYLALACVQFSLKCRLVMYVNIKWIQIYWFPPKQISFHYHHFNEYVQVGHCQARWS